MDSAAGRETYGQCVLPTPSGSRSRRHEPELVQTLDLLALDLGWKAKSNSASVFTAGSREERMAVCSRRLLRSTIWASSSFSSEDPAVRPRQDVVGSRAPGIFSVPAWPAPGIASVRRRGVHCRLPHSHSASALYLDGGSRSRRGGCGATRRAAGRAAPRADRVHRARRARIHGMQTDVGGVEPARRLLVEIRVVRGTSARGRSSP